MQPLSPPDRTAPVPQRRRARRAFVTARLAAALAGGLAVAACGGGDGGGTTEPPATTTARLDLQAAFRLAAGTTGLTLRVTPTYERTSGGAAALAAPAPVTVSGTAAQTVPVTIDLATCLNDAAHTGGANACNVRFEVGLFAGDRAVDALAFGPIAVARGAVVAQAASFVEVAGVRVTRGGTAVTDGATESVTLGGTLDYDAVAVDVDGTALPSRAVSWTSESPAVATVDASTGVVTTAQPGSARLIATSSGRTSAVTVTVVAPPRALAVTLAGSGGGAVTSVPAGIDCRVNGAAACTGSFAGGSTVRLSIAADANSTFGGWGGACAAAGTAPTCDVAMTEARAVTATFTRRRATITLVADGPGAGTVAITGTNVQNGSCTTTGTRVECTASVDLNTSVTATATPAGGNVASAWSGGVCAGSAGTPCTFTASANATVGATFASSATAVGAQSIRVLSGNGAAFSLDLAFERQLNGSPAPSGAISPVIGTQDATPFTINADTGSPVTFRVRPRGAGRILSWGGACAGQAVSDTFATCTYTAAPGASVTVTVGP